MTMMVLVNGERKFEMLNYLLYLLAVVRLNSKTVIHIVNSKTGIVFAGSQSFCLDGRLP
jgi:hypothetical protein